MRLLQAMAGGKVGGAEEFFVRFARAVGRAGVEQRRVVRPNAVRGAALAAADVSYVEAPFGGALDFRTPRLLQREIDAFRPDVVLSWMSRASRAAGRARVSPGAIRIGRLGGYYPLKYYSGCDHLIGNTPAIVDHAVREGWPSDRAHYLPNFVDAVPAAPVVRSTIGTPAGVPVIFALGRLHQNKAFDVLLRALADVPDAHLWLAGDGPLGEALRRLAGELGISERVHFLGWRDDAAALLAAADVLVCPSRDEPFGNVIVEAWAHRVPVVAAAAAGPAWLVAHGRTGLLVPVDDAGALAREIRRVVADRALARTLADAGHADYRDRFTERTVIADYLGLFRSTLARCAA
jgi:glycosyltransferase involved in cell wall biosynthesis